MNPTTCKSCGLPIFHGPAGYAGPQCMCRWTNAAPRQPEGEGLEVVGYRVSVPDEPELGTWLDESAENEPQMCLHEPLIRLSDHQRAIAELREECERLRCDLEGEREQARDFQQEHYELQSERNTLRQQLAERDARIAWLEDERTKWGPEILRLGDENQRLIAALSPAGGKAVPVELLELIYEAMCDFLGEDDPLREQLRAILEVKDE